MAWPQRDEALAFCLEIELGDKWWVIGNTKHCLGTFRRYPALRVELPARQARVLALSAGRQRAAMAGLFSEGARGERTSLRLPL
jgi:hypothetical protein